MSAVYYRSIAGYLEYTRRDAGITRWPFDIDLDSSPDAEQDPRLLAFLDFVREQQKLAAQRNDTQLDFW